MGTKAAALQIREIAKKEDVAGQGLSIQANEDGSFFMEFCETPQPGDEVFRNDEVDDVKVFASTLTLQRIGGATIDYREGRFKLDVGAGCGCEKSECACK